MDIILVQGPQRSDRDPDTPALLGALRSRGLIVEARCWAEPVDWRVPLALIRIPNDYRQRRQGFLGWARRVDPLTRLLNPLSVLEWNDRDDNLIEIIDCGLPVVPTRLVPRGAGMVEQRMVLASHAGDVVIKPAVSAGPIGMMYGPADSEAALVHLASALHFGDVLVQPLIASARTDGETSLIYIAGTFSHAVRRMPVTSQSKAADRHDAGVIAHEPSPQERYVADWTLAQVPGRPAYARVDLVELDAGPAVIDLKLIEPDLFLRFSEEGMARFADYLCTVRLERSAAA